MAAIQLQLIASKHIVMPCVRQPRVILAECGTEDNLDSGRPVTKAGLLWLCSILTACILVFAYTTVATADIHQLQTDPWGLPVVAHLNCGPLFSCSTAGRHSG